MRNIPYGITFYFTQTYLPTKRHRKTEEREMVTCREVDVREMTSEEFPVALKVTDFGITPQRKGHFELGTIEIRWDGECYYKEARIDSGKGANELIPLDNLRGMLEPRRDSVYANPNKPFVEGESVIVSDTLDIKYDCMKEKASEYIIYDGKIWEKCGQPYYGIWTGGLAGINGSASLDIKWSYDDKKIDRVYYLATQRDLLLKEARKVAKHYEADALLAECEGKKPCKNIEVLMPETYTLQRDTESRELPGYFWDDELSCYVKEYGPVPAHNCKYTVKFSHDYDRYRAVMYTRQEDYYTNNSTVWRIAGQLLEDVRTIKFEDIKEIYGESEGYDLLKWVDEHKGEMA